MTEKEWQELDAKRREKRKQENRDWDVIKDNKDEDNSKAINVSNPSISI